MGRGMLLGVVQRSKYLVAGGVLALSSLVMAGATLLAQPQIASAAGNCPYDPSFPETNIAFCGMWQQDGANATLAQTIASLQKMYADDQDSCAGAGVGNDGATCTVHTHLQDVFNAIYGNAGSIISSMNNNDGNTFVGYSCKDGTLRTGSCSGTVLGTNMRISARWHKAGNSDFTFVIQDVWMHSPSTFFSNDFPNGVPTLIHKSATTGMVDFAGWEPCDNIITVTPTKPTQVLTCQSLNGVIGSIDSEKQTVTASFTANASAKYTTISTMTFDFGDSSTPVTATVTSNSDGTVTAEAQHDYTQTQDDQTFTAKITQINGSTSFDGAGNCVFKIVIPGIPEQPSSFKCVQLDASADKFQPGKQITFNATAHADNATITSYIFKFSDGFTKTITVNGNETATITRSFDKTKTYTATVTVTADKGTSSRPTCTTSFNLTKQPTPPSKPTALVNTGAGDVFGLFALAAAAGSVFHWFVLRRKALN